MERTHYIWTAGGSTVTVYLSADVIARLRVAAAANSAAPEIGGILLGRRTSDDRISVDDFELLPSEHRRGLTFTLSGADKRGLLQRLRASHHGLQPMGSFRTHRRQGLYMDQYDFDLMSEHFAATTDVMLLIRPADWKAGFFVWEEGDIARQKSYAEFPFDAAVLPLVAYQPAAQAAPRKALPVISNQNLPTLMKVGLIAATLGLVATLALYSHEHRVSNPVIPATSAVSQDSNPPQLAPVALVKPPVYPVDAQPDNQSENQYELHVKVPPRPSPFEMPVAPPPTRNAIMAQPGTPPELGQPVQTAGNLPLPVVARTTLHPVRPTLISEVSLEPSEPGVLRRGIHRVPVLSLLDRHKFKAGNGFFPARPVREVKPRLPDDLQENAALHPIDVKVWIDDTGQVTKAELLTDHGETEVADIAATAACKWSFQPARLSDRPVASEMVMHFRFVPKQNY